MTGPIPKDPADRARRNVVHHVQVSMAAQKQPNLPPWPGDKSLDWPVRTQDWWRNWRKAPGADAFTAPDWDYLLDTAWLHAQFWQGATNLAAELRLRVAKFGATPEDRWRMRMVAMPTSPTGPAGQRDQGAASTSGSAARYAGLRVVGDTTEGTGTGD